MLNDEMRPKKNEDVPEPIAGDDGYLRIPEGKYETQIIGTRINAYPQFRKREDGDSGKRIVLQHRVIQGEHLGVVLYQYFKWHNSFSNLTAYYQAFVLLNGSAPKKKNRMSPKLFMNAICEVWVGTTARKGLSKEIKPESLQYSVVKEILRVKQRDNGGRCE